MSIKRVIKNSYLLSLFAQRRFNLINSQLGDFIHATKPIKILEVGCACGRDIAQFIPKSSLLQYYGLDINTDASFISESENITRIRADARYIPFRDKFFDIVFSIGVLEHIVPIEDLCKVISEIQRVGKNYYINVPAITTIVETHTMSPLWQLRAKKHKKVYPKLVYFSDDAWSAFSGFNGCNINRVYFIPLLISDLIITSPKIEY